MRRTINVISQAFDATRPLWGGLFIAALTIPSEGRPLFSPWIIALLAALFIILWALAGWHDRLWWRRTPLDIPWLFWILLIPVTLWVTALPDVTYAALRLFAAQAVAFWIMIVWVRTPTRARWATMGLLAIGMVLTVAGVLWVRNLPTLYFPIPQPLTLLRERFALPIGELVHRNVLAGTLMPLWFLSLGATLAIEGRWKWIQRGFACLTAVVIGLAILLLQSRGSWGGMLAGMYTFAALIWRPLWVGLFILSAGAGIWYVQQDLSFTSMVETFTTRWKFYTLPGRLEVWSRAFYALQDFPFTGIGMGTFHEVIPALYPLFRDRSPATVRHAHNLFLQVGVDLGLPGFITFLAMVFGTSWFIHKALQSEGPRDLIWILRGATAGLAAVLGHGLVDAITWNTRPAFVVWALWGLCVGTALTLIKRDHR